MNNDSLVLCDLIRHLLRKCHLPQGGRLWMPQRCPPKRLPLWGSCQHPLMLTDEVMFEQRFAYTERPHPSFAPQMPPSPEGEGYGCRNAARPKGFPSGEAVSIL